MKVSIKGLLCVTLLFSALYSQGQELQIRPNNATNGNIMIEPLSDSLNVFLGGQSGLNTNGPYNTFIGSSSGYSNTTGSGNSYLGVGTGFLNVLGSRNTILGQGGGFLTKGSGNVFLGYQAGTHETGSNKLYISNSQHNSFEALVYGEFDNQFLRFNANVDITDELYVSENVGIGTNTPKQKLHNTGDYYGRGHVYFHALEGDGVSGTAYLQARDDSGSSSINMRLRTQLNGNIVESMSLLNNGNVGIGTTNPLQKLSVANNGAEVGIRLERSIGGEFDYELINSTGQLVFRGGNDGTGSNLNEHLRINLDGYVGIGTTNPLQKLSVANNGAEVGIRLERTGGGQFDYELINYGGSLIFRGGDNAAGSNLTEHFRINTDGRVGIGTIGSAGAGLAAGHILSVNGKIAATEVRVQASSAWPDYVFESDYKLMPLDELENLIDQNGHLPGIPSANEVEENGIIIGEMQTKMMEKIEELTLYIIEMQKQIDALENDKK